MADIFIMYAVAWVLLMIVGSFGYLITRGGAYGYFLLQLLTMVLILSLFSTSFGAIDPNIWMMYAFSFGIYLLAFMVGVLTKEIGWVIIFQTVAFALGLIIIPWAFGITGGL